MLVDIYRFFREIARASWVSLENLYRTVSYELKILLETVRADLERGGLSLNNWGLVF